VGKGNSLGKAVELPVSHDTKFSVYDLYYPQSDRPQRIVLVNLHEWHRKSSLKRGTTQVTLDVGNGVKSTVAGYMSSESGSFAQGYDVGGGEVKSLPSQEHSGATN
jgi:hypothetical protein